MLRNRQGLERNIVAFSASVKDLLILKLNGENEKHFVVSEAIMRDNTYSYLTREDN
jgi:hypothetical protein